MLEESEPGKERGGDNARDGSCSSIRDGSQRWEPEMGAARGVRRAADSALVCGPLLRTLTFTLSEMDKVNGGS